MADAPLKLHLAAASAELLREVLERQAPSLVPLLSPAAVLRRVDVEAMVNAISDEFTTSGLGSGYEPSAYGKRLEDLLDEVNRVGFT
jgi:hypothetical protein